MTAPLQTHAKTDASPSFTPAQKSVLQRRCACGGTPGPTGECAQCRRQRTLGPNTALQPKLTINQPGDRYEEEADRVAERVMRMPEPRLQRACPECEEEKSVQTKPLAGPITPLVQRQEEPEEEEEETAVQTKPLLQRQAEPEEEEEPLQTKSLLQRQEAFDEEEALEEEKPLQRKSLLQRQETEPDEDEEEEKPLQPKSLLQRQEPPPEDEEEEEEPVQPKLLIQRKAASNGKATAPPIVHDVLRGPGQPLDASTRAFMEPRFGHDFSRVHVHADDRAAASARAVRAQAYTVGRNVVFGAGRYAPGTNEGKRLLAHELTHVVQQGDLSGPFFEVMRDTSSIGGALSHWANWAPDIAQGKRPLKLVFFQSRTKDRALFKQNANLIANAIKAPQIPSKCPRKLSTLFLSEGAQGFGRKGVLPLVQKASRCFKGAKVSEMHVVGHLSSGLKLNKTAGQKLKKYTKPDLRLIFHGCWVSTRKAGLKTLLKQLGPKAHIFAHSTKGEAGRPIDFYKVNLPAGASQLTEKRLQDVRPILPESCIKSWARKQRTTRLYKLLRSRLGWRLTADVEGLIIKVIQQRLKKIFAKWSLSKLQSTWRKKTILRWERTVLQAELIKRGHPP